MWKREIRDFVSPAEFTGATFRWLQLPITAHLSKFQ